MDQVEKQVAFETWWANLYRDNMRTRADRLRKSGRVSSDEGLRAILNKESSNLTRRLGSEVLTPRGGRYSTSSTLIIKVLESIEPLALSHLIISTALNHIMGKTGGDPSLAAVGGVLVGAVEQEMRIRFIEKVYPELIRKWRTNRGTFTHRNRALGVVSRRKARGTLPQFITDSGTRSRLGMALVEMLLLASGMFEPYVQVVGKKRIWSIKVQQPIIDRFNRATDFDDFVSSVPPLGLYLHPVSTDRDETYILKRRPLVTNNWLKGRPKPPSPPPNVVGCLEKLNAVGYRVNTRMLEWVQKHQVKLSMLGVLPQLEFKLFASDSRASKREKYDAWHKGETKRRGYFRTLTLADKLRNETFYHDWFVDFRGRMYTTSSLLSPQGNPLQKALIEFSETASIEFGTLGFHEFWTYGKRMVFGKNIPVDVKMEPYIQAACDGSLDPSKLGDTKDYLPFIAWSLEAIRLVNGERYVKTGIMLRRDATASSIQHMATMAQDKKLMRMVNLVDEPVDNVSDLYSEVDAPGFKRSSLKSHIMTLCYNSTAYGRAKRRMLDGEGRFGDLLREDATLSMQLEPLLEHVAEIRDVLTRDGESRDWQFTSPSGVTFDGRSYDWPEIRIWVRVFNIRRYVHLQDQKVKGAEINTRASRSGYVANVIHSLDAAMLHNSVEEWPESVAFIHDCVACLPGRMDSVCGILRRSFFEMHKNLFETFLSKTLDKESCLDYDEYVRHSVYMFV